MTQATLSQELTRQSISLARALSAAARNWALYPPEHPTAVDSVTRLSETIAASAAGAAFTFGVTPKTLLVAGYPLPEDHAAAEAACLLHDHDILQITFVGEPEVGALHSLLALLARSAEELRAEGGPGKAWSKLTHTSVAIEQIDYEEILEDGNVEHELEKRDDVWRSVVNSIVEGRGTFDSLQQQRLLEIAGNAFEIHELATAVSAPKCNINGSPLITTQATTVLATFRLLARIVTVMDPERLPQVMRNVAVATTQLDPHVVMQIMQTDEGVQETPILGGIAESFDDEKVAELLATALARDGKATARLARIFDTIVPDAERKQRVLRMTRTLLSEHDVGRSSQFWASGCAEQRGGMVNVAALSMAQARALNLDGPLLREFGFAALMHDIGKVNTPLEVLNKPGKLTDEEFKIMKRHVVDGAHILRRTPEMPALAPVVAFEHHLRQDLSGYPENIGHRKLNLCTQIVSIADVFDALRSNRPYREGLATARIRSIMGEQGNPAFNQTLLRRFVNLMGLFPVGTVVRLNTEEIGVVTAEHPEDPFRPQVKILFEAGGARLESELLVNTWERDSRGTFPKAVVESVDPDSIEVDPLTVL